MGYELRDSFRLGAWPDLAMMTLTFLLTLLWNVEVGITVSVAVSLLLVIHRSSRARLSILVRSLLSCSRICCLHRWSTRAASLAQTHGSRSTKTPPHKRTTCPVYSSFAFPKSSTFRVRPT